MNYKNNKNNKKKIIEELLHESDMEMTDEELIGEILSTKVTENYEKTEKVSFGQKAADAVARFAGSWAFIFSFVAIMIIWMILNVILAANAFDAYPFILLNLVLSCIAAIQAPLIMMSQNRQEAIDRRRAENDYKVNLKSEFLIDELYKKTEQIYETQKKNTEVYRIPFVFGRADYRFFGDAFRRKEQNLGIPFVITNYRKGVFFAIFRDRSGAVHQVQQPSRSQKIIKKCALFGAKHFCG